MHARTPLPACGLFCFRWVSWVPAIRNPDSAWTPRVTSPPPPPDARPRCSAGRHPRFPGDRVWLAGHRQAPPGRTATRTYLLRAEVPAQATAAARVLRHGPGGSRCRSVSPSVRMSRGGEIVGQMVAALRHPETPGSAPRHAPQDSGLESRGGLHSGAACRRTLVGLRLAGALDGP